MIQNKKKIIVILGPTASGKTKLAVELANRFNGEIVSADSRQVYKGMDIGSGKDLGEYNNVAYHLIDVVSPIRQFNLAKYQVLAFKAIVDILNRGKLPILTGGSGLYLQAIVDNFKLSNAKKDLILRKELERLKAPELYIRLKKLNRKMASKLNFSDKNNKRRLIRYIEILEQDNNFKSQTGGKKYQALLIGLKFPRQILRERIFRRLMERLKRENLIGEISGLHSSGLSWKRLYDFGLEYRYISLYLQNKLSYAEMVEKLNIAINQFSKKQMTWFRRWEKQGAKIIWLRDFKRAEKSVITFLKK